MILRNRLKKQGPRIVDQLTYRGFDALVLENDFLRILVLPEKGSDIIEFVYKPLDLDFLWRAPSGFWTLDRLFPGDITTRSSFIDYYPGGWQEILPNGGPTNQLHGVEFPEHSETPLLPWSWEITADEPDRVAVTLQVRLLRLPILIEKTLRLGKGPILYIDEVVRNLGTEDLEIMWGHHPTLGAPFIDKDCVIDLPAAGGISHPTERFSCQRLVPNQRFNWPFANCGDLGMVDFSLVLPPYAGKADLFYLTDLKEGWFAVTNQKLSVTFGLAWTPEVFKHLWVWHDANGTKGYPWYGQGYVLAIEPWSSYPSTGLQDVSARGTQMVLHGGDKVSAKLIAVIGTGCERVKTITQEGEIIRKK
jgi:hypothetical protein